jgi:hypothetical protein
LGEFVGDVKPKFKGAIEGAGLGDADARDAALDGGLQAFMVLRGSGCFEGQEGLAQLVRESVRGGENRSQGRKVIGVVGVNIWREYSGGRGVLLKGFKELGEASAADFSENRGLGELG